MLSVPGLLFSILTAVVIAQGLLGVGGLLVLFVEIFDMFDGAMARIRNAATNFGAFFDLTLDPTRKVLSCWDCSSMFCNGQTCMMSFGLLPMSNAG